MTETQLREAILYNRPLSPDNWLIAQMIREHDRFIVVANRRVDPNEFEPWSFGSPEERKAHRIAWLNSQAKVREGKLETARQVAERIEAQQIRAGGGQGINARTSPLQAERRRKPAA